MDEHCIDYLDAVYAQLFFFSRGKHVGDELCTVILPLAYMDFEK